MIPCDKIRRKYRGTFFSYDVTCQKKFNLKIYQVYLNVATVKLSTTKFFLGGTDNNYGWQCYTVGHLKTVMEKQTDN